MTADGYEEETLLVPVFSYFPVGSGSASEANLFYAGAWSLNKQLIRTNSLD